MNKLWSQTKSKAKTIDIWESYKEDPETYKVSILFDDIYFTVNRSSFSANYVVVHTYVVYA